MMNSSVQVRQDTEAPYQETYGPAAPLDQSDRTHTVHPCVCVFQLIRSAVSLGLDEPPEAERAQITRMVSAAAAGR